MTIEEKGAYYHKRDFNCCQSVLCTLGEYTGIDEQTAAALGVGFGGGMLSGNVCGAVTGGMMAIGKACAGGADPTAEKPKGIRLCKELQKRFQAEFGTMLCAEILKANGHAICDRCIAFAARSAEEIIKKNRTGE